MKPQFGGIHSHAQKTDVGLLCDRKLKVPYMLFELD